MSRLPEAAEAALIRGIGAYLRTADRNELPPELKRLRNFRPQALGNHRTELLRALEKGPTAALILQWLEESKPPLSKADAAVLRAAASHEEGWELAFAGASAPDSDSDTVAVAKLHEQLERETSRAVKARAAERAAKEALGQATETFRVKEAELTREVQRLRRELAGVRKELEAQTAAATKAMEDRARDRRRSQRDLDKEKAATQQAEDALKDARRLLRKRQAELGELRRTTEPQRAVEKRRERRGEPQQDGSGKVRRRKPLKAPLGRLEEDPETLESWLRTDGVQLLVDGYNVSKSVSGFSHLSLEEQRKRVVNAVNRLARKNGLAPIVVFDGAEMTPGVIRRPRGPAVVEYSAGEIADDHLVARLERLPLDPVVVVTNDKELQDRARALGATIASSDQLLALAR